MHRYILPVVTLCVALSLTEAFNFLPSGGVAGLRGSRIQQALRSRPNYEIGHAFRLHMAVGADSSALSGMKGEEGVDSVGAKEQAEKKSIASSSSSSSSPTPSPGPIAFVQRVVMLAAVMLKMSYMSSVQRVKKILNIKTLSEEEKKKRLLKMSPAQRKVVTATNKLITVLMSRKFWLRASLFLFSSLSLLKYLSFTRSLTTEVSYADFLKLVKTAPDKIDALRVTPSSFTYLFEGKQMFSRIVNVSPDVLDKLLVSGVNFAAAPAPVNVFGFVWTCCYAFFLWNISTRMMQGPQDEGAGKRRDEALASVKNLSFSDIAGQERAKVEVQEVCTMLRFPQAYAQVGARLPAGVLLVGPPGTGKTLLARVAAAEAGVPFYACSATDFVEVFVGRGPSRVRKLFKQAATNAPCIVFIDEIDSLGRSRRMGSLNSEQENTLNQLLTSMDGLDTSNNGVIVMAATNRYELLDPALLRAGRFDRIIQCPLPDKTGREAILKVHCRRLKVSHDVDLEKVARLTSGSCGADLSAIVNEAAIRTARRQGSEVNAADFDDALRSFFSARGLPLSGIAEAASSVLPTWLGGGGSGGRGDEGKAAPAM